MEQLAPCPECSSEMTYEMPPLLVCPMCAHEWSASSPVGEESEGVTDAFGNLLADGDTVMVIKDLKIKGSSGSLRQGTKVRNIRLIDGVGDHDIGCKIEGFGQLQLKSSVVKRV